MMKHSLLFALALCLSFTLLAGCAQETVVEPEPTVEPEITVEETPVQEEVETPTEEPVETQTYTLYLPNSNVEGFDETTVDIEPTAEALLQALVDAGALPQGTKLLSMEIDGTHMDLDLSQAYGTALSSTGTAGELMLTGTLVNTFIKAYDVETVSLTCEGKVIETGHTIYDFPLEFQ